VALLGPRTNSKTPEFATPVPLPPALPGLDAVVARVESLPPDADVPLEGGGAIRHWREKLEGGADVALRALDGWPAVVSAGAVRYLGGWPDEIALERMLTQAAGEAGVAVEPMPGSLRCRDAGGRRFYFNYGPVALRHQGMTIAPAGVHWRDIVQS
jgi:beta-galactosidase